MKSLEEQSPATRPHRKELNDRVVVATSISPDQLSILLYELPGENISFG
jgi:hypothetical protein